MGLEIGRNKRCGKIAHIFDDKTWCYIKELLSSSELGGRRANQQKNM
jgi:hypothetical protein